MKKTLNVLLISLLFAFVACGPNQEQLNKEKAKQDSIAKAAMEPQDFKTFLTGFLNDAKEKKNQSTYIHKDIGVYVYTNPGAFCTASKSTSMADMDKIKEVAVANIFDKKPKGSFCEGYPGEKDGFYYAEITKDEIPSYFDMNSQGDKKVVLPANLNYKKFIRVNVISKEYFSVDLYFVCIDTTWYLIGQSFCDCSA